MECWLYGLVVSKGNYSMSRKSFCLFLNIYYMLKLGVNYPLSLPVHSVVFVQWSRIYRRRTLKQRRFRNNHFHKGFHHQSWDFVSSVPASHTQPGCSLTLASSFFNTLGIWSLISLMDKMKTKIYSWCPLQASWAPYLLESSLWIRHSFLLERLFIVIGPLGPGNKTRMFQCLWMCSHMCAENDFWGWVWEFLPWGCVCVNSEDKPVAGWYRVGGFNELGEAVVNPYE